MTKTTSARYALEFKQEAVRLIDGGQSIAAATRTLGVAYEPLKTLQAGRVRQLRDFAEPKDAKQLSKAEFQPVVTAIDAHITSLSRATVQTLVSGAK